MKKPLTLILILTLCAALLSGCALLDLASALLPKAEHAGVIPSDGLPYEEADVVFEDMMMPMATSLPLMMNAQFAGVEMNTEEYAALTENGFRAVATSPLSTFSADVDTAAYCNLRRMLNNGWAPDDIPAGAVRIEEMLNYFRYDYAAPEGGAKFGVTAQIAPCPWNPDNWLLTLGLRAADAPSASEEGSNLVFLVDVSGSMDSEDKLPLAQQALKLLTDTLSETDTVSIVTYASGERVIIEGANPVTNRDALYEAIDSLSAYGSTAGERGLAQAYDTAMKFYREGGNNRVIMCSDGDLNVGVTSESGLHDFVSEKKKSDVYLSVLGFGQGNYKDTKMETLADDGNGNYYYIDSILEARKVLCEELTQTLYTVADDVKFQIEFNPARVQAYRQIGYENRALENEAFEDDAKDAGEVGAGACVTVMYELIPASGEVDSGLKYQQSTLTDAADSGEWMTVSVRFKEPGGDESQLETYPLGDDHVTDAPGDDFRFAAAVAEFGMILQRSEYAGDADYRSVVEILKDVPLSDDYREEFFSLVKIAERADKLHQAD